MGGEERREEEEEEEDLFFMWELKSWWVRYAWVKEGITAKGIGLEQVFILELIICKQEEGGRVICVWY